MANEQYHNLIVRQNYPINLDFVYFASAVEDKNEIIVLDDLVSQERLTSDLENWKIGYKIINQLQYADSELIIVQNEHDFILFDSLINRRSQFLVTDVTKSSGLFCIRDDPSDEKRHKLKVKNKNFQPLKVTPGLNSSKFEVYKESCAEN